MKLDQDKLLKNLKETTEANLQQANEWLKLEITKLNQKPDEKSWSMLECVEHLNRYSAFYLPEIARQLPKAKSKSSNSFKSGWLGNYFAQSMLPKERLNKMKTFKSMNPAGSHLTKTVLEQFITDQEQLLELLEQAKAKDLTSVKTGITLTKFIRFKLGDTFRFYIFHNLRHVEQGQRCL
jgi:hypothetical protein